MNGLLDFVKTPEGQGLLSAAFGGLAGARRGQPINSLGRAGLAGLAGYGSAQDRISQEAQIAEANKYRNMQTTALQAQMDAAKTKAAQEAAKRDALPGLFAGQTVGGGTTTPEMGGIPMFSQGSTVQPTRTVGAGKLDVQAALRAGYSPEEILKMGELSNVGRQKVARTVKGMENGREVEYQMDDYGQRVGDGLAQYRAPIEVAQGDRRTFADPYSLKPIGSFGINQSPDSVASNAVTMRGQNMTDGRARERMNFDRAGGADAGKPQLVDGQWVYKPTAENPQGKTVPVAGFNPKLPESQQKQVVGVNNLSNAITEYRDQLKGFGVLDAANPDKRAAMGTKYNNMMLQAKEAYNLGVLNGPDLEILTSVITDPRSFTGLITSNKALDAQASELDRIMQNVGQVSGQAKQPQSQTGGASASFGEPAGRKPAASSQDKQAMDWANANPNDPRAKEIKQRLGGR